MKDTNKKMELFKRLSNLRDAEDKYKCLSIQHDLKKREREEGRKLLEEARTKEINDEGPTMGQNNCKIQTSKGRGVRQERSSNQKNNVNINYTHKQLKYYYTNADSLINKFTEFKARVESHKCIVIAITEVKPKNQKFLLNTAELGLSNYDLYQNIDKQGRGVCIIYSQNTKRKTFHIFRNQLSRIDMG